MDFREIDLCHKQLFDRYFRSYDPETSELTFTNLFMWRLYNRFKFIEYDGYLCIVADPADAKAYAFCPIPDAGLNAGAGTVTGLKHAIGAVLSHFREIGRCPAFCRITEKECGVLKSVFDTPLEIIPDRNNSDYLYKRDDLAFLAGKRFDGKRNHISRFKREHSYEYMRIGGDTISECMKVMEKWCKARRRCEDKELAYEKGAVSELLINYERLGCTGAVIKVDGNYESFTAGEMLNWNTAVVHVEKANHKINGLYAVISQEYCEKEWQNAVYVNREQDMGIEGIRRSKMSNNPVTLIKKYSVFI